jgi:hypothetical protein
MTLHLPIKLEKIPQETCVQQKTAQAYEGGGPNNRFITTQPGVHRRRQKPQLHEHQSKHNAEDAANDNRSLMS